MNHKTIVSVRRSLEMGISHPETGEIRFRLDRIGAQHLAASLLEFSGAPSNGVTRNAGAFNPVQGDLLSPTISKKPELCPK